MVMSVLRMGPWATAATAVGAAALRVAGPAWAEPQSAPQPAAAAAAPSDSDLQTVRIDPEPMVLGGRTELHAFVANAGPEETNSPMFITVTLPREVTVEGPFYPDTCEPYAHQVHCEFPAGLKENRSATALVPLRIDRYAELGTYKGSFTVQSADDRIGDNNRVEFEIPVVDYVPE